MSAASVVAKRLKEARICIGISQKELGIRAGIDTFSASPRINQYERGKHEPDLRTLTRLAAVLDMPVPYFYCEDPELAYLIVRFSKLRRADRRKMLALVAE
jgi:transcriptional regulator with XRE-family HTH domain